MMMMMKLPILPCAEKRASFVYRTKNVDNNDKDSKNRKTSGFGLGLNNAVLEHIPASATL